MTSSAQSIPDRADASATDPRCAVLINPGAFRMSVRDRARRISRLLQLRGQAVEQVSGPAEIARALARAMEAGANRLILVGGDGTVQASVSWLAAHLPPSEIPELVVLGGGRTNFVARDLGTRKRLVERLEQALDPESGLKPQTRQTMRLLHPVIDEQHAFFVAAGSIDHVIRQVHAWRSGRRNWQGQGRFATQAGLLRLGWIHLRGRDRYQPVEMAFEADGLGRLAGPIGPVLLTTLIHDDGGLDPYADRGEGPIRLTAIRRDVRRFWRGVPGMLRGRFGRRRTVAEGYLSGRCSRLAVHGIRQICVDGQEFDLDPQAPLLVEPGIPIRFLRP